MLFSRRRSFAVLAIAAIAAAGLPVGGSSFAQTLNVRTNRWLEFRALTGDVTYRRNGQTQPARVGARIGTVGDEVRTGSNASARLAVDTEIGFVLVSENTALAITQLRSTRSGGRVTELTVRQGQARLQLRQFTDPATEFNIRTPAGVSGVRGTDFGVSVQPTGQTGVATLEGEVAATAAGQTVSVAAGFQTLIVPGEPPTPPVPLADDPSLDILRLQRVRPLGQQLIQIQGRIDPVNLLILDDETQTVDPTGTFDLQLPIPTEGAIQLTVVTPLGTQQTYELALP